MIKIAQGKANEAREEVQRQLEASPTNPLLYNLLGQIWIMDKRVTEAEIAFRKAIDLDNALLPAYMNLGQAYLLGGKTDQAKKEYEAVLAKSPQSIQAHMMLGIIHAGSKEYDRAKSSYEAILKINSKFAPAANNLAWILVEQGRDIDMALSYGQTAREQRPDDPYVADTLGWIYYKKNAYLLAASLLKEAVEKLPAEPVVHFHLGMALHKKGDVAGARASFQRSLKISRTFPGSDEAKKLLSEH
jgi:Flp pilus assembly protein TadD